MAIRRHADIGNIRHTAYDRQRQRQADTNIRRRGKTGKVIFSLAYMYNYYTQADSERDIH